jgi:hypothetical protein
MSTGGVKLGGSYDEARTRKVNAEAEIAELELAKVRSQLVIAADVVKAWTDVLGMLKSKLTNIPNKAAPIVASETDAGQIESMLTDLINESLEELSAYDPKVSTTRVGKSSDESEGGDASSEASTKAQRGKVGRPKKTTRLTD